MGVLSSFEPREVFDFFEDICRIPHGSGNTGRISAYLADFAEKRGLCIRKDEMNNCVIKKKGTFGYENSAPLIIQGHMDMVAVKDHGIEKDLENEGLDIEVEGDMISARGTSLGGDDGIALAYALAILDSSSIPHPPIEFIATVDEEIGMLGAAGLDTQDIEGRMMLNIDSEDEGILTVSCAGGLSAVCTVPLKREISGGSLLNIKLTGFMGGHSGTEINKGRLNSNVLMGRLLYSLRDEDIRIVEVSGGEKDNAISRMSEARILIDPERENIIKEKLEKKFGEALAEYRTVEKEIKLNIEGSIAENISAMDRESGKRTVALLMNFPNGIRRMNPDMENMVQTSLNIGIVSCEEENLLLTAALRSSAETEKYYLLDQVESFVGLLGGKVSVEGDYPGWEYRPESRLRDSWIKAYRHQYGEEPVVSGIHAGLECGIFSSKLPGLDCVSFGPQMENIHTTDEALSISSVQRTWELLKAVLETLK